MGIFSNTNRNKKQEQQTGTTKGLCLGTAEAESSNEIQLQAKVFIDCFDVIQQIATAGKFIILGRKGCGKTAIGEHIINSANNDPNTFACFIRKNQISLERIVQAETDKEITVQHLFEWIILTRLLVLISENQKAPTKYAKEIANFLKINSGYVNIDKYQITEVIKEKGFEVSVEQLKRLCGKGGFHWNRSNKETKAPFYQILPNLKDVVGKIIEEDVGNSYCLIFDDLDINFKSYSKTNLDELLDLIRIAKDYNNNFFRTRSCDSRVLILLRNDISKYLQYHSADSAKIFASYSIELNWCDGIRMNEDEWKIKKFINKRLSNAFDEISYPYKSNNPWDNFLDPNDWDRTSSFKYVLDHTFYRPRDFLSLFSEVGQREYDLPLSLNSVNELIGGYVVRQMNDISNELSLTYDAEDIIIIKKILHDCSQKNEFDYNFIKNKFSKTKLEADSDKIIEDLFDYSLVGNKNQRGKLTFKCRETGELCKLNRKDKLVLHKVLEIYFIHNTID